MSEIENYIISFKLSDGSHRVYSNITKEITTMDQLPLSPKLPPGKKGLSKFIMLTHENNKATDEDLIIYAENFEKWCKQLKNSRLKIDYMFCYSDYTAVSRTFNRWCQYKHHELITYDEYKWFEKCPNYGLQYLKKKDITKKCYSYDFKNQYGLILNSETMIPTKAGKNKNLKELPHRNKLRPGFYRVKIESNNDDFRKIFGFSKNNVYLKESLQLAMKHKKAFDVSIELILDDFPNAYIYKEEDMVTLNSITNEWFHNLTTLRKDYKDNRLLKHLISSLWGHMNANNTIHRTLKEAMEAKLDFGNKEGFRYRILDVHAKRSGDDYYELLDTTSPYKFNIRLKPWITGLARNLTASICLQDIDSVIRVQTDSVTFTKEMTFDDVNLVSEDKTTGKIHFQHCNSYKNLTTGYQTKGYKD